MDSAAPEWVSFYKNANVYGIEFIHANFVKHRFSRHVHDYFVLGIIENGLQTFNYRGETHQTAPSGVIILNPDEPHTGEPATPAGFRYKAIYPSAELMRQITQDVTGQSNRIPFFTQPVIYDANVAQQLLRLHHVLVTTPENSLAGESAFLDVFAGLITRYADIRYRELAAQHERKAIQRVRDFIETHYDRNISLTELAQMVAFSPYYLARTFTAEVGLPPHAYLESVRIRHAQHLLASGTPITEVALMTGFPHQSHFTNRFRKAVGVTPGQYVKQSKIAQDGQTSSI
jgi:AraC-like DNA-binding protein